MKTLPTVPAQPGGRTQFSPAFVLDQHLALTTGSLNPTVSLVDYVHSFAGVTSQKAQALGLGEVQDFTETDLAMMWWPYRVHQSKLAAAEWLRDVGRGLQHARAYQVTAKMVDVANKVYSNQSGTFHLEEAELPSAAGFVWLDQPLEVTDYRGKRVVERAISWSGVKVSVRYKGLKGQPQELLNAIRLVTWNWSGDHHLDEYYENDPESAEYLAKLSDLTLSHTLIVPFGERHSFHRGRGPHPESQPGTYRPDSTLAWVHVLWMLMEQEIVTMPRTPAQRPARRRASKTLKHSDISVVTLRRTHAVPGHPREPATRIDWQFQWMVQGHHRHIDSYEGPRHHAVPQFGLQRDTCKICLSQGETVRTTWVKSHLKGPDGMPLKASRTLYKLAR